MWWNKRIGRGSLSSADSGVYWVGLDYFSKAVSTSAVQGQAPSAEVSGTILGISLIAAWG